MAPTRSTVLVTGESGTGKELITNLLHQHSTRCDKPLIKVNCAAIPETLLEAELFGHEKGAFTGAVAQKKGRFELAHEGTLFLDEVGDMSLTLQAKLLRCIQEGEFERVGGTETLKVDVRLIAATNQDLLEAIAARRFRDDLYYRLNVISIHVPPLRERTGDIPLLIGHFIRKYTAETGRKIEGITQDCLEAMAAYPWPGNVRELENIIEQLVVMARETAAAQGGPARDDPPGGAPPGRHGLAGRHDARADRAGRHPRDARHHRRQQGAGRRACSAFTSPPSTGSSPPRSSRKKRKKNRAKQDCFAFCETPCA